MVGRRRSRTWNIISRVQLGLRHLTGSRKAKQSSRCKRQGGRNSQQHRRCMSSLALVADKIVIRKEGARKLRHETDMLSLVIPAGQQHANLRRFLPRLPFLGQPRGVGCHGGISWRMWRPLLSKDGLGLGRRSHCHHHQPQTCC